MLGPSSDVRCKYSILTAVLSAGNPHSHAYKEESCSFSAAALEAWWMGNRTGVKRPGLFQDVYLGEGLDRLFLSQLPNCSSN